MTTEREPEGEVVVSAVTLPRGKLLGIPRGTAQLFLVVLFLQAIGLGALVLDARGEAEAARAQSAANEQIIEEVQAQSERNGALVEQGVDCLVAVQQEAARNAENANQAAADFHGYIIPPLPDAVQIPTETQLEFIENACPRFFQFQEADPGTPPPPAEP